MRNLKLILLLIIPLFMGSQTARNYSNEFMNIGVDAAALGKSNAVVASTEDVNSSYWNPAGLIHIEDHQIASHFLFQVPNFSTQKEASADP